MLPTECAEETLTFSIAGLLDVSQKLPKTFHRLLLWMDSKFRLPRHLGLLSAPHRLNYRLQIESLSRSPLLSTTQKQPVIRLIVLPMTLRTKVQLVLVSLPQLLNRGRGRLWSQIVRIYRLFIYTSSSERIYRKVHRSGCIPSNIKTTGSAFQFLKQGTPQRPISMSSPLRQDGHNSSSDYDGRVQKSSPIPTPRGFPSTAPRSQSNWFSNSVDLYNHTPVAAILTSPCLSSSSLCASPCY